MKNKIFTLAPNNISEENKSNIDLFSISEEVTTSISASGPIQSLASVKPDKLEKAALINDRINSYFENIDIDKRDSKVLISEIRSDLKSLTVSTIKAVNLKLTGTLSKVIDINNRITTISYSESKSYFSTIADTVKEKSSKWFRSIAPKWSLVSLAVFVIFSATFIIVPKNLRPHINGKYSLFSSKPLILGDADFRLYSKDSRSQKINQVFKDYKCPLEGYGEIFVMEADKNNIPWYLVAAIAFQESSCGKMTPEINGVESYNAWGWGVWGENIHMFENWVRGIEQVSEYLNERFYSQGIKDPCEIMKIYTPPSDGSWCEGVKHYSEAIKDYKTPEK